ncbi:MAG: HD domain-containing protein [Firmicutes bacterium]|nr:HD domain-containing protein [Bacillota bacterium]
MSGKAMIADLAEGTVVDSWFMIGDSALKPSNSGNDYLELRLVDNSGDIVMRVWNADTSLAETFSRGRVLEISGLKVDSYRGRKQFSVDASLARTHLRVRDPQGHDMSSLIPCASRNLDELAKTLRADVRSVKDPSIRYLLTSLVSDEDFMGRFTVWPAAIRHHHAYMGGLLEHTVGVAAMCKSARGFYQGVHGDLLMAGAILHDIGKLEAYDYDRITGAIRMSKSGVLCDHILLGVRMLRRWLDRLASDSKKFAAAWPDEYTINLEHMLLSHHGRKEWGSPVEPATIEALILHLADYSDSQINKLERYIQSGVVATGQHTYLDDLRGNLYIGSFAHLDDKAEANSDQASQAAAGETPLF